MPPMAAGRVTGRLCVALLMIVLTACGSSPEIGRLLAGEVENLPPAIALDGVPFYPQEAYQCGPAALATVLNFSGAAVAVDELVERVYIPARQGSLQPEMLAATRGRERIPFRIQPSLASLLHEIQAGRPVLVFQNLGLDWLPQWHYAVVVGYDLEAGSLVLRSGTIREYTTSLALFDRTWRRTGRWGFVALRPGELPADRDPLRYLEALMDMEEVAQSHQLIPAYLAAAERWPQSEIFPFALGNLYYRDGQLELAGQQFRQLVQDHPQFAAGHNNLAQVLLEQGSLSQAEAHARQAVALGGSRRAVYQNTLMEILAAADSPGQG